MNILGINLNNNKSIYSELLKIFGIGKKRSYNICSKLGLLFRKLGSLSYTETLLLINELNTFLLETDLKIFISNNIKKLIKINCYRGIRHIKKLPLRGQRTRTNSRTARKNFNRFYE